MSQIIYNPAATLDTASKCPICFQAPNLKVEPTVYGTGNDYVLRCPMDHPYVAIGMDLAMAVTHWNIYVQARSFESHSKWQDQQKSVCKNCLKPTESRMRILGPDTIEICLECHLTKIIKEA